MIAFTTTTTSYQGALSHSGYSTGSTNTFTFTANTSASESMYSGNFSRNLSSYSVRSYLSTAGDADLSSEYERTASGASTKDSSLWYTSSIGWTRATVVEQTAPGNYITYTTETILTGATSSVPYFLTYHQTGSVASSFAGTSTATAISVVWLPTLATHSTATLNSSRSVTTSRTTYSSIPCTVTQTTATVSLNPYSGALAAGWPAGVTTTLSGWAAESNETILIPQTATAAVSGSFSSVSWSSARSTIVSSADTIGTLSSHWTNVTDLGPVLTVSRPGTRFETITTAGFFNQPFTTAPIAVSPRTATTSAGDPIHRTLSTATRRVVTTHNTSLSTGRDLAWNYTTVSLLNYSAADHTQAEYVYNRTAGSGSFSTGISARGANSYATRQVYPIYSPNFHHTIVTKSQAAAHSRLRTATATNPPAGLPISYYSPRGGWVHPLSLTGVKREGLLIGTDSYMFPFDAHKPVSPGGPYVPFVGPFGTTNAVSSATYDPKLNIATAQNSDGTTTGSVLAAGATMSAYPVNVAATSFLSSHGRLVGPVHCDRPVSGTAVFNRVGLYKVTEADSVGATYTTTVDGWVGSRTSSSIGMLALEEIWTYTLEPVNDDIRNVWRTVLPLEDDDA